MLVKQKHDAIKDSKSEIQNNPGMFFEAGCKSLETLIQFVQKLLTGASY